MFIFLIFSDVSPRLSPNFELSPIQPRHRTETAVNTQMEPSRVTSICLRYEDKRQPTTSATKITPAVVTEGRPAAAYVSRSFLNTGTTNVPATVELSSNGDRSWRFSKASGKETNEVIETQSLSLHSLSKNLNNKFVEKDKEMSPSRFSRNSQSPTKESLYLERTAERNILYNDNNRQMSSSPTSGTSRKVIPSTSKFNKTQDSLLKSEKTPHSPKLITKSTSSNNTVLKAREDKIDFVKKNDAKKSVIETKPRERRLSTSSSGRDGWLNTPRETPSRKKSEPAVKRNDMKKETKITERSFRVNGVRSSQKRTESPIYQNRDMYAEIRDSNENTETESTILEELTKAADQILLAVNGYTDDDSYRASSEDEYRKKRERTSQPLCTISELPNKNTNTKTNRQSVGVIKSTRSTDLRREYHSSSKNRIMKTASNSSLESSLTQDVKPLLTPEDRSKRRAARLLQRASSRELLFQTAASSSEDIGSGSDTGSLRTKRVYRRSRLQSGKHSGSKNDLTTTASESRTKER